MTLELGDSSKVRCVTSDLSCELDFKTKVKQNKNRSEEREGFVIYTLKGKMSYTNH